MNLARSNGWKDLKHARYEREEVFELIARRNEHDDAKRQSAQILLILKILVGGQEYVESGI